jgi:hypothetical protein
VQVDIVVVSRATGRPILAVETPLAGELDSATSQLGAYMKAVGCPTGLVVVRNRLRILQERYSGTEPGRIEVVADLDTSQVRSLASPGAGRASVGEFEERVQAWLEGLDRAAMLRLPGPLRDAVLRWILPALDVGEIRASGPRHPRSPAP